MSASVVIVGGGPAGAAAAIALARAGVAPRLIERTAGPHDVVCGGFLSWDSLAALRRLGVDPTALGAKSIDRVRIVAGRHQIEAALPHPAAGLSRRTLDAALIAGATAAGAEVIRGRAARSADPIAQRLRLDDGDELPWEALLLATGKHELRGLPRQAGNAETAAVGLRATLPVDPARTATLADTIELHLFDHGYAGLLLQEDGTANFCMSVLRRPLKVAGGPLPLVERVLDAAPTLAARLGKPPSQFDAVAGVPYGWRARRTSSGVFRIGDQGAVIASLAGDGIAMALLGGIGAARAVAQGGSGAAATWQAELRRASRRPILLAEALRHGAAHPLLRTAIVPILGRIPSLATHAALWTRFGSALP